MLWLLLCRALAGEPTVEVLEDNWVVATLTVEAPRALVDQVVADPKKVAEIDNNGVQLTQTPEGDCLVLHTELTRSIKKARYDSRACPTPTGWRHDLIPGDDNDMKEYTAIWNVNGSDGAVTIEYRVRSKVKLIVPQFLVNSASKRSLEELMVKLEAYLEAP